MTAAPHLAAAANSKNRIRTNRGLKSKAQYKKPWLMMHVAWEKKRFTQPPEKQEIGSSMRAEFVC
jgi:hypothetical protein